MKHIFTDTSINISKSLAVGCYYITDTLDNTTNVEEIKSITFNSKSSTIAEMTTIKYILDNYDCEGAILYTDCKNFVDLIGIRQYDPKLIRHRNYGFYKNLIELIAQNQIRVVWVKGHSKKELKINNYDVIFSVVDKQTRHLTRV